MSRPSFGTFLGRAVMCTAVGFALTIAVAWCSAVFIDVWQSMSDGAFAGKEPPTWQYFRLDGPPSAQGLLSIVLGSDFVPTRPVIDGPAWSRVSRSPNRTELESWRQYGENALLEDARGWPFPALKAAYATDAGFSTWRVVDGIPIAGIQGQWAAPRALPLAPIWLGLLADVAIYATSLLVFWSGARSVQRARRIRRGMCPVCAYPRGISPCCSECGEVFARADTPTPR